MIPMKPHIFTIGHSNQSLETFIALLRRYSVTAVADVRSTPYSRFSPQFDREALQRDLKGEGIRYVFLGRELGARSNDPGCYDRNRVQYARLARTELFRKGIQRLIRGAYKYCIAMMCTEKEPLECHRTLLVARTLIGVGVAVDHILPNGRLETHGDAMLRLLDVVGLPREDLFRSQNELIQDALARQEKRIAYVRKSFPS